MDDKNLAIERAANRGDRDAQFELGGIYRRGKGVGKNRVIAMKWYLLAAFQGDGDADFQAALLGDELTDMQERRGPTVFGHTDITLGVELHGGQQVPALSTTPDPTTFRGEYYYHATLNVLYKKVVTQSKPEIGLIVAHWQPISNPSIGEN